MKELYQTPVVELIEFKTEDVITTSGESDTEPLDIFDSNGD